MEGRRAEFRGSIAVACLICDPADVKLLVSFAAAILAMPPAPACTIVYAQTNVGPDFKVRVEDRGHPVKDLRVKIEGQSAVTDENGIAVFRGVRSGSNSVTIDTIPAIGDFAALNVTSNGPSGVTIPLKWPNVEPISVRTLKGQLHGSDLYYSLDLFDVGSGRKLRTLVTTNLGEFDFENTPPGLYVIDVNHSGHIVVEVDRGARADGLDLDIGSSSCGMFFADRNKCPRGDFRTNRLSGQVIDPGGAFVQNAKIELLDAGNVPVEELRSDPEGKFVSSRNLTGTYELLVRMPGFTPYHATVRLGLGGEPAHQAPLTIPLGIFGMCWASDPK